MDPTLVIQQIADCKSPLKRQLMLAALLTGILRNEGKPAPVVIGGCALAYYSREVYFTADIDLAYADREALDNALTGLGFHREGRHWVHDTLLLAVEAPAGELVEEDSSVEKVLLGQDLFCLVIGLEDLILDRLNAWRHWASSIDGEMAELLVRRYYTELDWNYLEAKAARPENGTAEEIQRLKAEGGA